MDVFPQIDPKVSLKCAMQNPDNGQMETVALEVYSRVSTWWAYLHKLTQSEPHSWVDMHRQRQIRSPVGICKCTVAVVK